MHRRRRGAAVAAPLAEEQKAAGSRCRRGKGKGDCKAEAETCVLETFWADNTFLQCENAGVGYRLSKDLDNRDSGLAPWGCPIEGIDCKDGWLAVEHRFLPIVVRGAQVLFRAPPAPSRGPSSEEHRS